MSGSSAVGPRVMLSREALDRTGLLRWGAALRVACSSSSTADSPPVTSVRDELKKTFPEAMITDFRETNPNSAGA